jgi:4-hydroxy-tetrahydrodipicolinate reductase
MFFAASAFSLLNENPARPQVANAASVVDGDAPKIVLWGFGNQNKLMAKYLYEKKIPVVGVVSRHDIGEDYGLVDLDAWGKAIGKTTGVKIVDEQSAASMLAKTKPDVCIISTRSTLEDLKPLLIACADAKVNVITIAEELLYSFPASPKLTQELDDRFKAAGVSFTGSGFIDGACGEMILAMSSMMQRIDTVEGCLQDNVDVYGAVVAEAFGIGLTKAQFQKEFVQKTTQEKSYFYYYNEWLAKALGMEVTVTTQTKEGVSIVSRLIGKIYAPDEKGINEWGFKGEPQGVKFSMTDFPTPQMTNTATISRIPQIIAAPPGYVTTDQFEITRYHS